MPKFKDGDKIRMREDCYGGNAKKGEICTITVDSKNGETWAETESKSFCNCKHFWELVEEAKPEKTWDNLEVGDSVYRPDGTRMVVESKFTTVSYKVSGWLMEHSDFVKNGFTFIPPQETITREEAEKLLGKKIK